jgi:hypothetical protein
MKFPSILTEGPMIVSMPSLPATPFLLNIEIYKSNKTLIV